MTGASPGTDELLREAETALRLDRVEVAGELFARSFESAHDPRTQAEALEGLGLVAHRRGRPRQAVVLFEQSAGLLNGAFWERPALAETLGRSLADLGELERAKLVFEECRRQFRRRGDRINEVRFACLVGYALTDRGRFAEAEKVLEEVLDTGEGVDDPLTRARLCWAQARLRGEQGRTELAIEHALSALEILKTTPSTFSVALTHELLASLYNDLGRSEEALALLEEAWPLLVAEATPIQVAHSQIEEARALAALGQRERAASIGLRVAAELHDTRPADAGRAYVLLGEIFDELGDAHKAQEFYEVGIRLLEGQGPSRYLDAANKRIRDLFEAEYRTRDALAVLRRVLAAQACGSEPQASSYEPPRAW